MAKKKKTSSRPEVPSMTAPSPMEAPAYEPMSIGDFENWTKKGYDLQLAYAPQLIEAQRQAQDVLYRNMGALQREQAPLGAATANQLLKRYDPEFRKTYSALGGRINEGLAAGYDLGEGLDRELTQAIRGAQTARGNILGAAPTAQEAFGKGQASIDLYNQRVGQAQNYLQGRNPMDMMGQTASSFMGATYYPSQAYVDTGLGASAMSAVGQQQSAYNSTVQQGYSTFQGALQSYNENQLSAYDKSAESWMYDEAVRRGLYSTPSVSGGGGGGGGGMMGGMGGTVMKGVGTGLVTGIGLAAAGASTGMAAAGGVAAAASAAGAAICWLARMCIPDKWEQFQHYLFTDAPEKLRRFYLYNARRLAREISDDESLEIGNAMYDCINLRTQS